MKKKLIWIVLMVTLFSGCGAIHIKREVENNVVTSQYPKIRIKIDSEFEYVPLEVTRFGKTQSDSDPSRITDTTSDQFVFISVDPKSKELKRAIGIEFMQLFGQNWYIRSDLFGSGYSTQKIGKDDYQYIIQYGNPSESLSSHAKERGCTSSEGVFLFAANKLNDKLLISIYYYEKLSEAEYESLIKKENREKLKAYLIDFNQRFLSSFTMIDD